MWQKLTVKNLKVSKCTVQILTFIGIFFVDQRWVGSFSFVILEECEDPESELSKIFNFSVKESSKYARENGTSPKECLL